MSKHLAQLVPKSFIDSKSISQQQSLAITKKLLRTSFGCITYLRNLFPEENYEQDREGSVRVMNLRRGYSIEADLLLDWLESGIFDALSRQYLKTVVLGIGLDKDLPQELVEKYTFSFSYPEGHPSMHVDPAVNPLAGGGEGVNMESRSSSFSSSSSSSLSSSALRFGGGSGGHQVKTVGEVKKYIEQMTRRLILYTQDMQPLSQNKHLRIRLTYWDDVTPVDYEPAFFTAASEKDSLHVKGEMTSARIGSLSTPYHSLDLQIEAIENEDEYSGPLIPEDTLPWVPNASLAPLRAVSEEISQAGSASSSMNVTGEMAAIPTQILEKLSEIPGVPEACLSPLRVANPGSTQENLAVDAMDAMSNLPTQVLEDLDELPDISDLPELGLGAHSDQHSIPEHRGDSEPLSKAIEGAMERMSIAPSALTSSSSVQGFDAAADIDRQATEQLATKVDGSDGKELAMSVDGSHDGHEDSLASDICRCLCSDNDDDGEMLECENCKHWGHVWCYGFSSTKDPRIPEQHVCYFCMQDQNMASQGSELMDIAAMAQNALYRRAVGIVWTEGYISTRQMSGRLVITASRAQLFQKHLVKDGFLEDTRRSATAYGKRAISAADAADRWRVIKNEASRSRLQELFQPVIAGFQVHDDQTRAQNAVQEETTSALVSSEYESDHRMPEDEYDRGMSEVSCGQGPSPEASSQITPQPSPKPYLLRSLSRSLSSSISSSLSPTSSFLAGRLAAQSQVIPGPSSPKRKESRPITEDDRPLEPVKKQKVSKEQTTIYLD